MTDAVYHWFVERCLRLELEIAILKGLESERPESVCHTTAAPPIESCVAQLLARPRRRSYRHASADEIAQMRTLKGRGYSCAEIARLTYFSASTVGAYTRDVLLEREAGAS